MMGRLHVLTPFGPRLFYTVHAVPKGIPFDMTSKRPELIFLV